MTGSHTHGSAGEQHRGRLGISLVLIGGFFAVEVAAGLLTNSLALLSDAAHMFTDVIGLGMALAAIHFAARLKEQSGRTFGLYRLEILAALANAGLLLAVAAYVVVEAVSRLQDPPEVLGIPMLVVATIGLAVNLVAFQLLRSGAKESLNMQGAYLEVLADAVGSVGVILAAVAIQVTGWPYVDPIMGVAIGLFVIPRAWRLAGQALRILLQAAPPGLDIEGVRRDLGALPGVTDVHDFHLWTLTSGMDVASAHLMISDSADSHTVLDQARLLLRDRYDVSHATLQVEPANHAGCEELNW